MTNDELEKKIDVLNKNVYIANQAASSARGAAAAAAVMLREFATAVDSGNKEEIAKVLAKIRKNTEGLH